MVNFGDFGAKAFTYYTEITSSLPLFAQEFISLFLMVVLIFIYSTL